MSSKQEKSFPNVKLDFQPSKGSLAESLRAFEKELE
jgi:hypothetical protein